MQIFLSLYIATRTTNSPHITQQIPHMPNATKASSNATVSLGKENALTLEGNVNPVAPSHPRPDL
jgi:hypothetical protein